MKTRDLLRRLLEDGWYLVALEGSHRQYKQQVKPGKVTVPGHLGDDIHPKTLSSILK